MLNSFYRIVNASIEIEKFRKIFFSRLFLQKEWKLNVKSMNLQKPKLFCGYKFYFMGEFVPSYKGYLYDLVFAAGGIVLNRKPISENQENFSSECSASTTFIVYSVEQPEKCRASKRDSILNRRSCNAEALATSTRAVAVSNSWILNSIAGCVMQCYK